MYFYSIPYGEDRSSQEKKAPTTPAIYVGRSSEPLVSLPEPFDEMMTKIGVERSRSGPDPLTLDKRCHFYPQLDLFLTIPPTNDKIIARPVNVRKILTDKGIDYLYVTSTTPIAHVSQPFQYQLEAVSKAGGVTYSLQTGPVGLSVTADGIVSWNAPAKAGDETVIVGLKDSSGTEAFHTFQVFVAP